MRTIGRRWPRQYRRDYVVVCDVCGVPHRRSQVHRTTDGLYQCPKDRERSVFELDRANAQHAVRSRVEMPADHIRGAFDTMSDNPRDGIDDAGVWALITEGGIPLWTESGEQLLGPKS